MKKKAILLSLCMAMLTGCGRVDSVDVETITHFEVEKTTEEGDTVEFPEVATGADGEAIVTTTAAESKSTGVTTTRTIKVNLVKRTGVVKATAAPIKRTNSRPSVRTSTRTVVATTAVLTSGATTSAVSTSASTTAVTTTTPAENSFIVTGENGMTCNVAENNIISVSMNGEPVQNIEFDTSFMMDSYTNGLTDPKYRVNICDLDFDGNYDLFIPNGSDDYNVYGKYLRYNPTTMLFEEWEALSGITTYEKSSDADKTITAVLRKDEVGYEEKTYSWNVVDEELGTKELRIVSVKEQYRGADNNIYIDYSEFIDNVKTLVKREKHLYDENGEFVGVQEVPLEWQQW